MDDALKTDLYQPSMVLGYLDAGKGEETATFELTLRNLPQNRNYFLMAGLADALDYLQNLRFGKEQIEYLKQFPQFANFGKGIWEKLENFRFTGNVWAVPDGTPLFQNEPILYVEAPRIQAQFVETFLLGKLRAHIRFASKAARVADAAGENVDILEFGSRHIDPDLAVICAYASYIAGCAGTSNIEAGEKYGMQIKDIRGTMAHAYVMAFDAELDAFRAYAKTYPDHSILLVDTYDIEQGIRNAIIVGKELEASGHTLKGIRIDSGDLAECSKLARKMLSDAGMPYVKIVLSGDIDETQIIRLRESGAQFDVLGVGKAISTCDDAPHIDAAYKLVEHELSGKTEYAIKISRNKATMPSLKQIYRSVDANGAYLRDEICLSGERRDGAVPILQKVMENGSVACKLEGATELRSRAAELKSRLPPALRGIGKADYHVEYSEKLRILQQVVRQRMLERNSQFGRQAMMR